MKKTRNLLGLLLLCLLALSGCRNYPQSQTQLLPTSPENQTQGEASGKRYTLEKIYTQEFTSYFAYGCYASILDCGDNQVDLLIADQEEYQRRRVDYRYGFYEELPFFLSQNQQDTVEEETGERAPDFDPFLQMNLYLQEGGAEVEESPWLTDELVSPDGKNLLFVDTESSYTGAKLFLVSMETGEKQLLLDGDRDGFSGEVYQFVTAWSRDGKTLCYGYFPRSLEGTFWQDHKHIFYVMDVESGEIVSSVGFTRDDIYAVDGERIRDFCVERSGSQIMIAVVLYQSTSLFLLDGDEAPEIITLTDYWLESPIYLAPEEGCCYFTGELDPTVLCRFDVVNHTQEELLTGEYPIYQICSLDHGAAFVTAEMENQYGYTQNICLYRLENGAVQKETLYLNTPRVKRFQYDPENRRLLAETDTTPTGSYWGDTKTAMLFTFARG